VTRHLPIREFFNDPALPFAVHRQTAQRPKELHTHDFSELVLILGGEAFHFTEKDEQTISRGDVFVIQGELAHGYRDSRDLSLINLMFDSKRLNFSEGDLRSIPGYHALFTLEPQYRQRHRFASRLRLNDGQLAHGAALVSQLELEARERKAGYIFTATALFMQLTSFLARCYDGEQTPESGILLRIGAAIGYLEDHYADPISVEQVTRIAGMSESSLLRAFKQATNRAPTRYLLDLRLRRARHLLRYTSLNITEIAFQTGFNDSNYFARQFRKGVGTSPREYRRQSTPGNHGPALH